MASEIQAFTSHDANGMPALSISMVQQVQQHQPIAKMYAQVHVSHYSNLMPYPHVFSPVYVPPMAMPGYFSNAAYPHPPNGNFTSPTGYAINTPAVIGSATGLDDSSRIKYKDSNLYVPNRLILVFLMLGEDKQC
ncbi:hypothetical protein CQW23_20687 [Capsicum baccatum]|uniref:Uncharacterized protein n=1 Tax=Capsicum baccatum TaxID=33114 RepID=A0A2G2W9B6_CAPBA|nr:hypothetical protein CQW23_20687 [Capsicum baccatum]